MKKKLSTSTVSSWFSHSGKRSQKGKIKQATESEINPAKLAAKSFQGTHFHELEHELFAWVRQCESRKACLTHDKISRPVIFSPWMHVLLLILKKHLGGYSFVGSLLCWIVASLGIQKKPDQICIRQFSGQGQHGMK